MLKIDQIVEVAIAALSDTNPRFPYLLILRQADGTGHASMWAANTTPEAVHERSPAVLFWGEVPVLDYYDLFSTASEWDWDFFERECQAHEIEPEEGYTLAESDFGVLAEALWNALSDQERDAHGQTFWDHYEISEQIRKLVEEAVIEDMKATLEPGYQLWRLKTGKDNQDALILATDWEEASNDACFEHDAEGLPAHWRLELIE